MVDYHKIEFELHLDDLHEHVGMLLHYRREVDAVFDVDFLDASRPFLGMIVNLSAHAHQYWIGETQGTLPRGQYNFFYIPAGASRWMLEPPLNSILCLECQADFLSQFISDVPVLEAFLAGVKVNKSTSLTLRHSPMSSDIMDGIYDIMREHHFVGKSRELYLRAKVASLLLSGLMDSQLRHDQYHRSYVDDELQRVYRYMVDNLQYLADTRPLLSFCKMPEEKMKVKFRERFGKSIFEALRYEKVKKAEDLLLHTNMMVREVAIKVGYSCSAAFLTAFKMHHGIYPAEFRSRGKASGKGGGGMGRENR
jgi:AraC-like DNA-binding protein